MQQYLVALDLDGTACNDESRLGARTKEAFRAARAAGHILCFASGRRDIDMVSLGEDYRCADYLLLNNGGKLVRTRDNAVLFNDCIEERAARRLIAHCLEKDYILHVISGMFWAVNRWTPGLQSYIDTLGMEPLMYRSIEEIPCEAIEGFMATDEMDEVCRFIDAEKLPLLHVRSELTCTDIMSEGITKWNGLTRLAALLHIPRERLIAAGDYNNDIEMICGAGIGVAVHNALPCVKQAADYVTKSDNNHDAAAEIIEHFLWNGEAAVFTGNEGTQ